MILFKLQVQLGARAETEDVMEQPQICKYGVIPIKNRLFLNSLNLLTPSFLSVLLFWQSFVVFVGFGPGVHVDIVSCKAKKKGSLKWNKVRAYGRQVSVHTSFYPFLSTAGKSVSDGNDDEGQDHVCDNDAGYRGWLNPVARHRTAWQRSEQTGGGEEWDGEYELKDWVKLETVIRPLCSELELLCFFSFILVYK